MTHLFVFLQIAAPGERLVAVLACVRVGVVHVGRGRRGGRGVRRRAASVVVLLVLLLLVLLVLVLMLLVVLLLLLLVTVVIVVIVDRGTGPAVARGAAVRGRVVLRHGRAPRRSRLFGAHLARAAQRF